MRGSVAESNVETFGQGGHLWDGALVAASCLELVMPGGGGAVAQQARDLYVNHTVVNRVRAELTGVASGQKLRAIELGNPNIPSNTNNPNRITQ